MEKEFIPYEQALAIKELGFDEPCLMVYNYKKQVTLVNKIPFKQRTNQSNPYLCTAPLYQQAFRWLYQKLDIEKGLMPLDTESQQLLLKELIDK